MLQNMYAIHLHNTIIYFVECSYFVKCQHKSQYIKGKWWWMALWLAGIIGTDGTRQLSTGWC